MSPWGSSGSAASSKWSFGASPARLKPPENDQDHVTGATFIRAPLLQNPSRMCSQSYLIIFIEPKSCTGTEAKAVARVSVKTPDKIAISSIENASLPSDIRCTAAFFNCIMTDMGYYRRKRPFNPVWALVILLALALAFTARSRISQFALSTTETQAPVNHKLNLHAASPKIHCYSYGWSSSGANIRCVNPADGLSPLKLPLVLGIGPAKTGSTVLFKALDQLPSVLVGNATLGGAPCCTYELYFFTSPDKMDVNDILRFYPKGSLHQAAYVSEKTPTYVSTPC